MFNIEHWDIHFSQRSFADLEIRENLKRQAYEDAWVAFKNLEENVEAVNELIAVNGGDGAPHVALLVCGAFSKGYRLSLKNLRKKNTQPHTCQRGFFTDWWMRINEQNALDVIAESLASVFRILDGRAATSLQTDSITEPIDTGDFTPDFKRSDSSLMYTTQTWTVPWMVALRKKNALSLVRFRNFLIYRVMMRMIY